MSVRTCGHGVNGASVNITVKPEGYSVSGRTDSESWDPDLKVPCGPDTLK